ncbi:hypothetical protein OROMI_004826 [Orobanche minor]
MKQEPISHHPRQGIKEGARARSPCVSKNTANVGCSYGCRCEGCQNVFGRKGAMERMHRKFGSLVESSRSHLNPVSHT